MAFGGTGVYGISRKKAGFRRKENYETRETNHALPHPTKHNSTQAMPHTKALDQPPPTHGITQNAKRNQRRGKSARLNPKPQPTPHHIFLAQLIAAGSLDNRRSSPSISNRSPKHTRIKSAQPLRPTRAHTKPYPKIAYTSNSHIFKPTSS